MSTKISIKTLDDLEEFGEAKKLELKRDNSNGTELYNRVRDGIM